GNRPLSPFPGETQDLPPLPSGCDRPLGFHLPVCRLPWYRHQLHYQKARYSICSLKSRKKLPPLCQSETWIFARKAQGLANGSVLMAKGFSLAVIVSEAPICCLSGAEALRRVVERSMHCSDLRKSVLSASPVPACRG